MKQVSIPVKPENKLNIKASDDLSVEGSGQNILTAIVRHSDSFRYTETGGKSEVKVSSDCRLQIPATMTVTVEKVGGDASFTNLAGRVIIGKVGGDLVLQNLGGASIEIVGGDLSLKNNSDALEVTRVGGDLVGTAIHSLSSRAVGGDVFLEQVFGSVSVVAGGDVELQVAESVMPEISVTAGGDIRLVVQPDARAEVMMISHGGDIEVHAGGQEGKWEMEQFSILLGEGGNKVSLTAGGDIAILDQSTTEKDFEGVFDSSADSWKNFGADIENQIRENLGAAMENIHWATRSMNDIGEKARSKVEKAMRKIDSQGVVIDHTGVNIGRNGKQVGIHFGAPNPPQEKPKKGPSDEERLLVLKMLQDKRITPEEADKILSALDK